MPKIGHILYRGFTLLELITTVAIVGLILGLAIPSFGALMQESRISNQYHSMVGSLYEARSKAIKGAADVTVCPKRAPGDNRCGGLSDWENGWIVFLDKTSTPGELTAVIDAGDEIVSVKSRIRGNNTISVFGSTTNTVVNVENVSYVRYMQNGLSTLSTGSIIICDALRGADSSRAINIAQMGGIRQGTKGIDDTAPLDAFSRTVNCP